MEFLSGFLRDTHRQIPLRHTMKSTCSYFYVHMHAHGKISCRIYIYTHIFTWNVGKRGVRRTMQYVPTTKFALRVLSAGLANSMHREALRKVVELTVAWLLDLYRIHASFIRMQILIQKWRFLRNEEMDFELFM